ncbi:MAG: DUF3791 domain-containing protein, partial [Spirochaetaceae bacterium]|nr:DUF3791 domain-containing protein [Spirochaetaceae bacterium]
IEEYKEHENLTGREVIDLFTRYDIIAYIKSAYNALHVMGGAAITGDIKSLIAGIRDNSEGAAGRAGKGSCLTERATKTP